MSLTVLTSKGPLLTKRWTTTGIEPYDRAKTFTVESYDLDGIEHLSRVLTVLESQPRRCVIRGQHVDPTQHVETTRDLQHFQEVPRHWVCFDVDSYAPVIFDPVGDPVRSVAEYICDNLPAEFQGVAHHWQLSSSAGREGAQGTLKAHIWFWLDVARTGAELEAWARSKWEQPPFDVTVLRTVQVHYTAAPVIDPGVSCPVRLRSGYVKGSQGDTVALAFDDITVVPRSTTQRADMVDPTTKLGIIGAFCRAYPPTRAIDELLGEHFEFETNSDHRLTWLGGGGTPGGACITDDGHHVFSGHATDPFGGRSVNTWDLCRHYLFGEQDAGLTDFELDDPSLWPSQAAMRALALSLPDVITERTEAAQAALDGPTPLAVIDAAAAREAVIGRALDTIVACSSSTELETHISPQLRDLDWSDIERERLARALQAQVRALTGAAMPIATVRGWLIPAPTANGFTDMTIDGRVLGTHDNVVEILRRARATVRYNVISKEDEILIAGRGFTVDNGSNASLAVLFSQCCAVDMKINPGVLKSYITLIADDNQYNPALTWIESTPWDGVDRLPAWYDTVTAPKQGEMKAVLMRRWALQCVAILHNSDGENQARGVLTFAGAQYIGKTRWLKRLAPEGMVKTGHLLEVHNKDSVKQAISYWICELGELDGTMRKSDLAALKAFISQGTDTMRRPYAACEATFPRRTSFAATVNDAEFLRDPSGNTRYWALDLDVIDADHKVDMQQLWAQVLSIWKGGEQHWLLSEEMDRLNVSNEDFGVVDAVDELVRTKLHWHDRSLPREWVTASRVAEMIGLNAFRSGDLTTIGRVVRKLNGGNGKKTNGVRLLLVPVHDPLSVA